MDVLPFARSAAALPVLALPGAGGGRPPLARRGGRPAGEECEPVFVGVPGSAVQMVRECASRADIGTPARRSATGQGRHCADGHSALCLVQLLPVYDTVADALADRTEATREGTAEATDLPD